MAQHPDQPPADWSVWAIDLGPSPLKTLASLTNWSGLVTFDRTELVRSRTPLPAQLATDLTESDALSCVEFGARSGAVLEARGYPDWGMGIADTPTARHEQIMLDYRECGPTSEPRIVYVDQEADYRVTVIAPRLRVVRARAGHRGRVVQGATSLVERRVTASGRRARDSAQWSGSVRPTEFAPTHR